MGSKSNEFWNSIERPIRPLVELLRDNGYNTISSCGHEMYVDVTLGQVIKIDSLKTVKLLRGNGYDCFEITYRSLVSGSGFFDTTMRIRVIG